MRWCPAGADRAWERRCVISCTGRQRRSDSAVEEKKRELEGRSCVSGENTVIRITNLNKLREIVEILIFIDR